MKNLLYTCIAIVLVACSTDRLIPFGSDEKINAKLGTASELLKSIAPAVEKIEVKSTTSLPIITKNGNEIWVYRDNFNELPSFPFQIEVIELLTLKDMILAQKPTVSGNKLLTTGGAFYLNATKDGKQLTMSISNPLTFIVNTKSTDKSMVLFVENQNLGWINTDSLNNIQRDTTNRSGLGIEYKPHYKLFPPTLGWINIDKFANYGGKMTTLKFTCENAPTESLYIYLVFPSLNSVMLVDKDKEFPLPVGEKIKVIAFAATEDKKVFTYFENKTIQENQTINIKLQASTLEAFEAELKKL